MLLVVAIQLKMAAAAIVSPLREASSESPSDPDAMAHAPRHEASRALATTFAPHASPRRRDPLPYRCLPYRVCATAPTADQ